MATDLLKNIKNNYLDNYKSVKKRVVICAGTGCLAGGAQKIFNAFQEQITLQGLELIVDVKMDKCGEGYLVSESGCQGFCQMGPLVAIYPDDTFYVKVKERDVKNIVEKTLVNDEIIEKLLFTEPGTKVHSKGSHEIGFYKKQQRYVLKECGHLDPEVMEEYIAHGGYFQIENVIKTMQPAEVCEYVAKSGLRGRGGGGFPTGMKWKFALKEESDKKYIICNGDEGDPGAFMDRSLMEGNPHGVIEGMMIAGYAIGANEAHVYVRAEYPLAVKRVKKAVKDAEILGILGDDVLGTGFRFKINVMEGAGAFVCGEETALIESIGGHRGMPRPKPPFPAQKGLDDKPTIINNVETLASIPLIFRDGLEFFTKFGTESSKGTKTFALTGHVANTGLIEVPFGATLNEIVFNIGGGVTDEEGNIKENYLKAVQIGGPSGGCLTKDHLDVPLDYDSLKELGSMIGSGGLVVMNEETCIIQVARYFMEFTQSESCGKCVLCREGTKQMLALLDDIIEGRATIETIELLEKLAKAVQIGSLCGLGKSAPNPVLSTLQHFKDEYLAHVIDKECPTKKCSAMTQPEILEDKCKGCGACIKACAFDAISGERKGLHTIDIEKCEKCGACKSTCKFNAIIGVN